jgi:hypothetical protein
LGLGKGRGAVATFLLGRSLPFNFILNKNKNRLESDLGFSYFYILKIKRKVTKKKEDEAKIN